MLLLLACIDCQSTQKIFDSYGKGAWAHSTEIKIQCFSNDSSILLSNGKTKTINSLKSGDKILTIDQSNIISTEMIFMLDKQTSKKTEFYKIITESKYEISLTEYHLIPIVSTNGSEIYLFAKQIQIGDYLFVLLNNQINYSRIINIKKEIKIGYYAPLTTKGTLLVNSILTSCFAHVNNHHLAQFYMFPMRFYYKLLKFIHLNYLLDHSESQGLHWIISIMFHFTRYFRPHFLFQ